MYYVYHLESESDGTFYTGFSDNYLKRLKEHNAGKVLYTSKHIPYRLIYLEGYLSKKDAMTREKFLKGGSGKRYLKKQLNNYFKIAAA